MKKTIVNIDNILIFFIALSPLSMLFQKQFDAANRVIVGGILICLILRFLKNSRINKITLLTIMSGIVLFGYSLLNVVSAYFSVNMLFYYPMWFLYLFYSVDYKNEMIRAFIECKKLIKYVIWLWSILVGISFLLPSSYSYGDFHSFAQSNFRFAPTVILMSCLIWMYSGIFREKKYMCFMFIPLAAMLTNGSRTYAVVFLFLFGIAFYSFFTKKIYFWLLLIPCVAILLYFISGSQFLSKFSRAANNQYVHDYWAAVTSNRSIFWAGELKMFAQSDIFEKLFGGGLTASFVKNVTISGQAIWAHNDFLEVLNAHGLVGVFLYILSFVYTYFFYKRQYSFNLLQKIVFCSCYFLNAFFNGLYVYTTAMLSIPFLAYAITVDFSNVSEMEY